MVFIQGAVAGGVPLNMLDTGTANMLLAGLNSLQAI